MQAAAAGLTGKDAILAMLESATERQWRRDRPRAGGDERAVDAGTRRKGPPALDRRPVSALISAAVRRRSRDDARVDATFIGEMIWDSLPGHPAPCGARRLDGGTLRRLG